MLIEDAATLLDTDTLAPTHRTSTPSCPLHA